MLPGVGVRHLPYSVLTIPVSCSRCGMGGSGKGGEGLHESG